jgi:hypothetical protein
MVLLHGDMVKFNTYRDNLLWRSGAGSMWYFDVASRRAAVALSCLRIKSPAASRPFGLPSFPRFARLTPPARLVDPGLRAPLAPKADCVQWAGVGGLAVPFTVSRRSRRQGRHALLRACVLAAVCAP